MIPFNLLVVACLAYVAVLFGVALCRRPARAARAGGWLRSPLVYTLSLSIYCTAWTFYGAVGYAARSGLEFMTIYLGPTLVFIGWWSKAAQAGADRAGTADLDRGPDFVALSGKSTLLGVIVTVISVVAATPYIALQLQSVTLSFGSSPPAAPRPAAGRPPLPPRCGSRRGLRSLPSCSARGRWMPTNATTAWSWRSRSRRWSSWWRWSRSASLSSGAWRGVGDVLARIDAAPVAHWTSPPSRWIGLTFVSAAAVLTLPRMFQVLVVENADERHLATAGWAFPLYLMAMSLLVLPIAVVGPRTHARGRQPRPVRADPAPRRGRGAPCDAGVPRRVFLGRPRW